MVNDIAILSQLPKAKLALSLLYDVFWKIKAEKPNAGEFLLNRLRMLRNHLAEHLPEVSKIDLEEPKKGV